MPFNHASRELPCRVIKVGGSLFQFDGLVPALREWHDAQTPAMDVLIAGGGGLTDAVRDLDHRFVIDPSATHWLCVRLMDVTARILHLLIPEAVFVYRCDELTKLLRGPEPALIVFSVEEFLQQYEPSIPGECLPAQWSSTSDSIAARLAQACSATELVLLKSANVPDRADCVLAAKEGYVDEFFPIAANGLPHVRCVNLRTGEESILENESRRK